VIPSNNLKKALQSRRKTFGAWTSLCHPSITEIFTQSGVDFVGIDIEHSTISQEQSQRIIAASQAAGVPCLPRIASHNMEMIKRLLDSGADGIICPMVETPQDVENLIRWTKYTPVGRRSYGISRAQNYGFDFAEYTGKWNDSSVLVIQVESVTGIENIEKLLQYPEVDGAMIGPYDLSGSLGIPGQLQHARMLEAMKHVQEACAKYGKSCGTQIVEPNPANIAAAFSAGYTFAVLSSDVFLLWKWAARMKEMIGQSKNAK
jgi:2-dehydro-3-deoxyglucarate aldolase